LVDELRLIRGALHGKRDEYAALVDRHQDAVYALVSRQLGDPDAAAEAVQATFVRGFVLLRTFRGNASFESWILQIANKECRSRLRRRESPGEVGAALTTESSAQGVPAEAQQALQPESGRELREAILRGVDRQIAFEKERASGFDPRILWPIAIALLIAIAGMLSLRSIDFGASGVQPARAAFLLAIEDPEIRMEVAEYLGEPLFLSRGVWPDVDATESDGNR